MTVSFNDIPSDILTPGHYVEIDPTGAVEGAGVRPHAALLVGYRLDGGTQDTVALPTGTAVDGQVVRVTRVGEAQAAAGRASMLAEMAEAFLKVNERTPLYIMGIDDSAGTEATGVVTFTASTPLAGVVSVYVAGTRYQVSVATNSSPTSLATALVGLVNADGDASVTAASSVGVVTLKAKHPGPEGNSIDLRISYLESDAIPSGVTCVVTTPMSSGATTVDISAQIAALAGTQYDTIVCGMDDATTMTDWETELALRWKPMVNLDGHLFVGHNGNHTALTSYLSSRNSEHTTVCSVGESPTSPWVIASDVAAIDAAQTTDDPARPRTTIRCISTLAPGANQVWTQSERNIILQAGGATLKLDSTKNVIVERLTTTYTVNAQGALDPIWKDLSTKRTVSMLRWSWDTRLTLKYGRHKLDDDGTNFDAGQAIVTPSTIRAEAIAWFSENEGAGYVENLDQFRTDLVVERDATDRNRINDILRPDVINKLVVTATRLQPRL